MRAAIALGNIIGEAQYRLVIAVIPPQRQLNANIISLRLQCDGGVYQGCFIAVKITGKGFQPAVKFQLNAARLGMAHIFQNNTDTAVQKCQFAQAVLQRIKTELGHGESGVRRVKGDFRAGRLGLANDRQIGFRLAMRKAHFVQFAIAANGQLQPIGQCIDDGNANPVQAARDFITIGIKLTAGVQLRHNHLRGGNAFFRVHFGRNATAIIRHRHRAIGIEAHRNLIAMTGQSLINGIIDHLIDHMVQAGAVIRIANIHARALAHRFQPFQDLNGRSTIIAVLRVARLIIFRCIAHVILPPAA
ncbi:MAG: Uncharacterised protein [Alphaproteobacteria bacterium]|nr:MAG: Uncharacterised protein [Alphaproteobacteria bacterium]